MSHLIISFAGLCVCGLGRAVLLVRLGAVHIGTLHLTLMKWEFSYYYIYITQKGIKMVEWMKEDEALKP